MHSCTNYQKIYQSGSLLSKQTIEHLQIKPSHYVSGQQRFHFVNHEHLYLP